MYDSGYKITSSLWGTGSGLAVSLGVALALGAAASSWASKERLWRLVLATACALGLVVLVGLARNTGAWPSNTIAVALAAVGVTTGMWGLVHRPSDRLAESLHALVVALGLGALLLVPLAPLSEEGGRGLLFGFAEVAFVLSCAALWHGMISSVVIRRQPGQAAAKAALGSALLLLSTALLLHGVGAQWSRGAYWSWEPLACWWLTAWAVVALAVLGVRRLGWSGRRATIALWLVAGFVLLVLLGAVPLVQWLGLNGRYWTG